MPHFKPLAPIPSKLWLLRIRIGSLLYPKPKFVAVRNSTVLTCILEKTSCISLVWLQNSINTYQNLVVEGLTQ